LLSLHGRLRVLEVTFFHQDVPNVIYCLSRMLEYYGTSAICQHNTIEPGIITRDVCPERFALPCQVHRSSLTSEDSLGGYSNHEHQPTGQIH
jgi:hypothetical protein